MLSFWGRGKNWLGLNIHTLNDLILEGRIKQKIIVIKGENIRLISKRIKLTK